MYEVTKKLKLQDRSTNYVKTKARWTRLPTWILSMLTWICYKISLRTPKIFQNSAIHICTICIHHLILGIFAIFAKPFWLPIENSTCQNIKKNRNGFWRLQKLWLATNPTSYIYWTDFYLDEIFPAKPSEAACSLVKQGWIWIMLDSIQIEIFSFLK